MSKATPQAEPGHATVADFVAAMEDIAPIALAQDWDNVGLLAGDFQASLTRTLLAIDLTAAVLQEAKRKQCELILAYHPPIFKPIASLRLPSTDMSGLVFDCIRSGIAIYSTHTALDAADGGTNDVIAELCGAKRTDPLVIADRPGEPEYKLVVFIPPEHVDPVAEAVFAAGAGNIGDYTHCSYRVSGEGTFFGAESTNPTVGRRGTLERVREIRLESVVPARRLHDVVEAMRRVHPYEEPAFDVYPLARPPVRGIGRTATLPAPISLGELAANLTRATGATNATIAGSGQTTVTRAIIVVGAAGSLPFKTDLTPQDVIITGEIRHHDALALQRRGCSAIALGHWPSERPALASLAARLGKSLPLIQNEISETDRDPFQPACRG